VPAPRKYDKATRARAVRMYQERLRDLGESKLIARPCGGCGAGHHFLHAAQLGGAGGDRHRRAAERGVGGGQGAAPGGRQAADASHRAKREDAQGAEKLRHSKPVPPSANKSVAVTLGRHRRRLHADPCDLQRLKGWGLHLADRSRHDWPLFGEARRSMPGG
jgi:hypothetical protein